MTRPHRDMTDRINSPALGRDAGDIDNVGDYQTLVPGAEVRGKFFCTYCGANITSLAQSVPNDMQDHVRPCPNCNVPLSFNGGRLAVKVIEAQQRELHGLGPVVDPGSGAGAIREVIRPNGRKLIVACPGAAVLRATAHGRKP